MSSPLRRSGRSAASATEQMSPSSNPDIFEFPSSPGLSRAPVSRVKPLPKVTTTAAVPARKGAQSTSSTVPTTGSGVDARYSKGNVSLRRNRSRVVLSDRSLVLATPARRTSAVASRPNRVHTADRTSSAVAAGDLLHLEPASPASHVTWAGEDPDGGDEDDRDASDTDDNEGRHRSPAGFGRSAKGLRKVSATGRKVGSRANGDKRKPGKPTSPSSSLKYYLDNTITRALASAESGFSAARGRRAETSGQFAAVATLQASLAAALNKQIPGWDGNAMRAPAQGTSIPFAEAQSMVRTTRSSFEALFQQLSLVHGYNALADSIRCRSGFGQWLFDIHNVKSKAALLALPSATRKAWKTEYMKLGSGERLAFLQAAVTAYASGEQSDAVSSRDDAEVVMSVPRGAPIPDIFEEESSSHGQWQLSTPAKASSVELRPFIAVKPLLKLALKTKKSATQPATEAQTLSAAQQEVYERSLKLAHIRAVLPALALRSRVGSFLTSGSAYLILAEVKEVKFKFEELKAGPSTSAAAAAAPGLLEVTVVYTARSLPAYKLEAEENSLRLGEALVLRRAVLAARERRSYAAESVAVVKAAATAAPAPAPASRRPHGPRTTTKLPGAEVFSAPPALLLPAVQEESGAQRGATSGDRRFKPAIEATSEKLASISEKKARPVTAATSAAAAASPASTSSQIDAVLGRVANRQRKRGRDSESDAELAASTAPAAASASPLAPRAKRNARSGAVSISASASASAVGSFVSAPAPSTAAARQVEVAASRRQVQIASRKPAASTPVASQVSGTPQRQRRRAVAVIGE